MISLKKKHLILISLLGGLLLSLGWPEKGIPVLLFIGMVPFFFVEDHIYQHPEKFRKLNVFYITYIGFFFWNVLTTWWVWNSTAIGSVFAWGLNSLFMATTFYIYHLTRKNLAPRAGGLILVFFWITFEFIHHNWDGTWPWLSLGNGFSAWPKWVQWYEYTGIFGGTLWILVINLLFYNLLKDILERKPKKQLIITSILILLLLILPVVHSYRMYDQYREKPWPVDVVVVQPNFDPWNEQFNQDPGESVRKNLELAGQVADSATEFIVCPESTIQELIWEHRLENNVSLSLLKKYVLAHPYTGVVIGASTFKEYGPHDPLTPTVRKFRNDSSFYDAYNTAFYISADGGLDMHHKSKLTPGVEKMPFAKLMKPLEEFAINIGGTVGSLGSDEKRKIFRRQGDGLKIAPVICYESVFGEYLTEYIYGGANLIFVITNDGWWGNSPGHRQHLAFSSLRAIETRRSIARSANTGISAFIDQRGDIHQATKYWQEAVIREKINANDRITFYVSHGDYIARVSGFASLFLLLSALVRGIILRRKR